MLQGRLVTGEDRVEPFQRVGPEGQLDGTLRLVELLDGARAMIGAVTPSWCSSQASATRAGLSPSESHRSSKALILSRLARRASVRARPGGGPPAPSLAPPSKPPCSGHHGMTRRRTPRPPAGPPVRYRGSAGCTGTARSPGRAGRVRRRSPPSNAHNLNQTRRCLCCLLRSRSPAWARSAAGSSGGSPRPVPSLAVTQATVSRSACRASTGETASSGLL